jgi:hypothetical protein
MPIHGKMYRCVELMIPKKLDQKLEEMLVAREMTREALYIELLELAVMEIRTQGSHSPWKAAPEGTEYKVHE